MSLHDDQCEQLPDFYLCHCRKRERLARGLTQLPRLIVEWPICSGCSNAVQHDGDSLRCDRCHVKWGANAGDDEEAAHFWDDHDTNGETLANMREKWIARNARIAEAKA